MFVMLLHQKNNLVSIWYTDQLIIPGYLKWPKQLLGPVHYIDVRLSMYKVFGIGDGEGI